MSYRSSNQSPFFAPNKKSHNKVASSVETGNSLQQSVSEEPKSTLAGATFNLMNAIIGAGIVGVPYAVRECGFVWGLVMIIFCAILTVKSLRLLIGTAKHIHVPSYEMLAEAAFGKAGFLFVSMSMFVMAYGAMVTYLMIVKNVLPDLLGVSPDDVSLRRTLLALTSFCIMLPLSAQRDMANLAKTSTLSVLFDCVIVVIVSLFAPARDNIHQSGGLVPLLLSQSTHSISSPTSLLIPSSSFFIGLGVLSFAFVCQHSAFIIAGSLSKPTRKRWSYVTAAALISCCFLAILMGVCGYLGYLDKVQGNVLNNLVQQKSLDYYPRMDAADAVVAATQDDSNNPSPSTYLFFHKWSHLHNSHHTTPLTPEEMTLHRAANMARALLCTAMFFVYPMEAFVARHVCVVLFFRGRSAHEGDDHYVLARRDRRLIMTLALYLLALIPALCFDNVGSVLAITGAVGGSCLSYIGPGLIYLAIYGKAFTDWAQSFFQPATTRIDDMEDEETRPLQSTQQRIDMPKPSSKSLGESYVLGWNIITWYACCMPLWCQVAQYGQDMSKKHKEEQALKSPSIHSLASPKQFNRDSSSMSSQPYDPPHFVVLNLHRGQDSSLVRSTSFEKKSSIPSVTVLSPKRVVTYQSTCSTDSRNNGLVKDSASLGLHLQDQQLSKERDEEVKPTATDFGIAIFFVVFGFVAASAGLFSVLF